MQMSGCRLSNQARTFCRNELLNVGKEERQHVKEVKQWMRLTHFSPFTQYCSKQKPVAHLERSSSLRRAKALFLLRDSKNWVSLRSKTVIRVF